MKEFKTIDVSEVKAAETEILKVQVCGYNCEVVKVDGAVLLYADGHFEGEIYEEETAEDYIAQIKEILE